MQEIKFISGSKEENTIYLSSVDPEVIIHFLREKDYCVEEMWELVDFPDGSTEEKQLGRPDEEPIWIRKNHSLELNSLMEYFEYSNISRLEIKLNSGGYIKQRFGELIICFGNDEDLKTPTLKVLEMYGYFASNEIWSLITKYKICLPIAHIRGYEPSEITAEILNNIVKYGQDIIDAESST